MRIAARYADEWNCWGLPELMAHKAQVLERHCLEIGRDPATIKRSAQAVMLMSDDAAQLRAWRAADSGVPRIIGTPSEIADVMARYGEVGVDEFVVADHSLGRDASQKRENMDRFVEEVAVHLQERSGS